MNTIEHKYGTRVTIFDDPFLNALLTRLCIPATGQPEFNTLIRQVYEGLFRQVLVTGFPKTSVTVKTRMATEYPQALLTSKSLTLKFRGHCRYRTSGHLRRHATTF